VGDYRTDSEESIDCFNSDLG